MKQNQVEYVKNLLVLFLFVVNYYFCSRLNHSVRSREAPGTHLLSVLTFNLESEFVFCFFSPCELGVRL